MRIWTGVTDNTWFTNLAAIPGIDEVNFWHPSGKAPAKMEEGTPFLFKLKSPNNHIAGGGFLVKFERLPLRLAWEAFGEKNGAASFDEFARLIRTARAGKATDGEDIGCSIISEPFFLSRERWIQMPPSFVLNTVTGKWYDSSEADGSFIWEQVHLARRMAAIQAPRIAENLPTWGQPTMIKPRRGQGAFRALVTNAYQRRCAITGESTLPVLEAAHIKPVSNEGLYNTFNGLLLRSDFHKLFDVGLVTVTPDFTVLVSDRIKQQWFNGKAYNNLHGRQLSVLPVDPLDRPHHDFLRWHNDERFERVA